MLFKNNFKTRKMTQQKWQIMCIKNKWIDISNFYCCCQCFIMMCTQTHGSCINWISPNHRNPTNECSRWLSCPLPTAAPPSSRKLPHFSAHCCLHVCNLLSLGMYRILHFVFCLISLGPCKQQTIFLHLAPQPSPTPMHSFGVEISIHSTVS